MSSSNMSHISTQYGVEGYDLPGAKIDRYVLYHLLRDKPDNIDDHVSLIGEMLKHGHFTEDDLCASLIIDHDKPEYINALGVKNYLSIDTLGTYCNYIRLEKFKECVEHGLVLTDWHLNMALERRNENLASYLVITKHVSVTFHQLKRIIELGYTNIIRFISANYEGNMHYALEDE